MSSIAFQKMVGAGNDFVMIDAQPGLDYTKFTKKVCDRHFGVGADGVIVYDKSDSADCRMRIINADGSEAEMCGNGARCFTSYVFKHHHPGKDQFSVETMAGELQARMVDDLFEVQLTDPIDYMPDMEIPLGQQMLQGHFINTGVPHTIVFVEQLQEFDVDGMGRIIREHDAFKPKGTNVNFVEKIKPGYVALRTYERGVEGETLACGTGSVAAGLIGYIDQQKVVQSQENALMKVVTKSGEVLDVTFDVDVNEDGEMTMTNVWLKGSAKLICEGQYYYSGT